MPERPRSRRSLPLQALVHVEVEQARLRLGRSFEGVGVHTHELEHRLLGQAGIDGDFHRLERADVILVENVALVGQSEDVPETTCDVG
jgi:hypothetical protein